MGIIFSFFKCRKKGKENLNNFIKDLHFSFKCAKISYVRQKTNKLGDDELNNKLNVVEVMNMLLKKWYIIFIAALVGGVVAFVFTDIFIEEKYSTEVTLYVNASNKTVEEISSANINASQQLVNTYAEILKSRNFIDKIIRDLPDEMKIEYTYDTIKGMLTMEAVNETEILSVTVTGTDAEEVYKIADLLTKYSPDELENVMGAGKAKILNIPLLPEKPVSPNVRANTLIGVLIGIFLAAIFVVILELLDTRIRSGEEFASNYEEPLLGEIPTLEETQSTRSKGRRS